MFNPEIVANRRFIDRVSTSPRLAALAARWQPVIAKVLGATGRPIQNLLHGTPLGHALHPVITDVPVGAWTVTAVLDAVELLGGPALAGADAALCIGLIGATGAVATGYADWSDTADDARTLGMAHALANGIASTAYIAALWLRRSGHRRAGLVTALVAYGVMAGGAYLGGELSTGLQLGAKHTGTPIVPPAEFTAVLAAAELIDAHPARVDFAGVPLLLTRAGDRVSAIAAVCTHRGGPLDEGEFADGCVTCPWHGARFSLIDGRVIDGPATFPQPRFEARVNDDRIEVRTLRVE